MLTLTGAASSSWLMADGGQKQTAEKQKWATRRSHLWWHVLPEFVSMVSGRLPSRSRLGRIALRQRPSGMLSTAQYGFANGAQIARGVQLAVSLRNFGSFCRRK